jgi:CMP/dCMP kinase
MIITLSGLPGAGKSTIKNLLAEKLGLKKYSMGDMRGEMAKARGMTIDEFNALGMTEAFTDKDADAFQTKLAETEDNFVIDSWLGWHFIPQSKKIFLDVDPAIAAERIFADRQHNPNRDDEPEYASVEETRKTLADRVAQTHARYQKWYGVDFMDRSHYDLVLDTTKLTTDEVLQKIIDFVQAT